MPKQTIEALVEAGAASAGPPLGPALGPTGVPIKKVIDDINAKTKDFSGMRVPVKVVVDTDARSFEIVVGTPATSQLIKKEVKLEKLAQKPGVDKVADIKIEQIIKISKMKSGSLFAKDPVKAVKTIVGTCASIGVLVEGRDPKEVIKSIDRGEFREKILAGKTELTREELAELERKKAQLAEETKKRIEAEKAKAAKIVGEMLAAGKAEAEIRKRLEEEKISKEIIDEAVKAGGAAAPAAAAGAAAPAAEKKEKKEEKK